MHNYNSTDAKGKDSVAKSSQRSNDNKPSATTEVVNRVRDNVEKVLKK